MTELAAASGIVIYEEGARVYISKKPAPWINTFLFVAGLLTIIVLVNGLLQLIIFKESGGSTKTATILIIVATFFAILYWRVWAYRKKVNATPAEELPTIAIIDLETNNLLDGQNHMLSSLNEAWLDRKMQLTSSSPELIIRWNGGCLSLAKGNPFSGGIGIIEKILVSKGIRKS